MLLGGLAFAVERGERGEGRGERGRGKRVVGSGGEARRGKGAESGRIDSVSSG